MMICLAGCVSNRDAVNRAARDKAKADVVSEAITEAKKMPGLPPDCRKLEAHGIVKGDRLDVAALKSAQALGRANSRVARCAAWYDGYRKGQG